MEKVKSFLRSRKKQLLFALVSFIFFSVFFYVLSTKISIAFTIKGQYCFPYSLWLIKKGETPSKNEYIAFKNPNVDGKATWIKKVSGLGGDLIRVERIPEGQRKQFKIFIDEIEKELTVQGFVYLYSVFDPSNPSQVFMAFETDSKGKPLPIIAEGKIPYGKFFVSSEAVRSYDSRYWGLVSESDVIGKAYPIF